MIWAAIIIELAQAIVTGEGASPGSDVWYLRFHSADAG
jgi:hypothetical protein